ncbi:MAG TPA: alpha-1,4-glucan--maltose-1-phosphate maltosyltransferase [Candidatus Limnocylindrales bacterium]|nr:alpha-1,4-glucan--maltose-1-phosphate maltosyltransferase [Candidatus Limnocylindrales bacterium]
MTPLPAEGRVRAVVEGVSPVVDGGRFPVKRVIGDRLVVEADAFADGHDVVVVELLHAAPDGRESDRIPMEPLGNDRWRAELPLDTLGRHAFAVTARVDPFATWRRDLAKWRDAGQDLTQELIVGANLVEAAAARTAGADARALSAAAARLRGTGSQAARARAGLDERLARRMHRNADRSREARSPDYPVFVDPVHARFSTWYELFPRSASPKPGRHGTLRDVIRRLDYVAGLGFDVLYLPPIHPIGHTHRKGPNNRTTASPGDPGVPWAIGAAEGGHTAVHPELGTLADVDALVTAAARTGVRVALDIAFQVSPDHPWAREHPEWFRRLPDGTIRYAENPPKKYEDIYPFDFDTPAWQELWTELLGVFRFWMSHGVRIFRVDNPHTKAFPFWEWAIAELKRADPDVLFLSEAFTRPKVMYRLAKLGFSQSYTYYTWRTGKQELIDYFEEITRPPVSDIFRPNVWPNTPDILHESLQHGGRPAFALRVVLAATLAASYGIYGPAYELAERVPREPGSEEYLDSEKYQIRHWDLEREDSLAPLIGRLNAIRRSHPALQTNERLVFHETSGDHLLAYSKRTADGSDVVLTIVNLDPHHAHAGSVVLDLPALGLESGSTYEVHDLLDGATYRWWGATNYVELAPQVRPAHVFEVRR